VGAGNLNWYTPPLISRRERLQRSRPAANRGDLCTGRTV